MHRDTLAEIIEAAGTAGTSLMKELFTRRQEEKAMEQRYEHQRELAAARAEGSSGIGQQESPDDVPDRLMEAEELAEEYTDLLDDAAEMESCDLCTRLIREAQNQPASKQADLLPQLAEFLESVESGESTQQVAQRAREHNELMDLLQQSMGQGR